MFNLGQGGKKYNTIWILIDLNKMPPPPIKVGLSTINEIKNSFNMKAGSKLGGKNI